MIRLVCRIWPQLKFAKPRRRRGKSIAMTKRVDWDWFWFCCSPNTEHCCCSIGCVFSLLSRISGCCTLKQSWGWKIVWKIPTLAKPLFRKQKNMRTQNFLPKNLNSLKISKLLVPRLMPLMVEYTRTLWRHKSLIEYNGVITAIRFSFILISYFWFVQICVDLCRFL